MPTKSEWLTNIEGRRRGAKNVYFPSFASDQPVASQVLNLPISAGRDVLRWTNLHTAIDPSFSPLFQVVQAMRELKTMKMSKRLENTIQVHPSS
jgi:hypothetical protein